MGNSLDRERYKVAIPQLEKRLTITEQSQKDILESAIGYGLPYAHLDVGTSSTTEKSAQTWKYTTSFSGKTDRARYSDPEFFSDDQNGFIPKVSGYYLLLLESHINFQSGASWNSTACRFYDYTTGSQIGITKYSACGESYYWTGMSNMFLTHIDDGHIIVPQYMKYTNNTTYWWRPNNSVFTMILVKPDKGFLSPFKHTIIGGGGGGATITVDTALSETSVNPVQNRAIFEALDNIEVDTLANSDIQEIIDSVV